MRKSTTNINVPVLGYTKNLSLLRDDLEKLGLTTEDQSFAEKTDLFVVGKVLSEEKDTSVVYERVPVKKETAAYKYTPKVSHDISTLEEDFKALGLSSQEKSTMRLDLSKERPLFESFDPLNPEKRPNRIGKNHLSQRDGADGQNKSRSYPVPSIDKHDQTESKDWKELDTEKLLAKRFEEATMSGNAGGFAMPFAGMLRSDPWAMKPVKNHFKKKHRKNEDFNFHDTSLTDYLAEGTEDLNPLNHFLSVAHEENLPVHTINKAVDYLKKNSEDANRDFGTQTMRAAVINGLLRQQNLQPRHVLDLTPMLDDYSSVSQASTNKNKSVLHKISKNKDSLANNLARNKDTDAATLHTLIDKSIANASNFTRNFQRGNPIELPYSYTFDEIANPETDRVFPSVDSGSIFDNVALHPNTKAETLHKMSDYILKNKLDAYHKSGAAHSISLHPNTPTAALQNLAKHLVNTNLKKHINNPRDAFIKNGVDMDDIINKHGLDATTFQPTILEKSTLSNIIKHQNSDASVLGILDKPLTDLGY